MRTPADAPLRRRFGRPAIGRSRRDLCLPQWMCPPKGVQRRTGTPKGSNGEHGPQRGPTANRDPKGVQRRTGTPKGSNGEQGPQRGPTANRDPTAPIQPRGTKKHFASSTTTAYPGLTCSAGVYPPRKTPYIPRPRGMNPRATEPDAKCSKPYGAEGSIAEEFGVCQYILTPPFAVAVGTKGTRSPLARG